MSRKFINSLFCFNRQGKNPHWDNLPNLFRFFHSVSTRLYMELSIFDVVLCFRIKLQGIMFPNKVRTTQKLYMWVEGKHTFALN